MNMRRSKDAQAVTDDSVIGRRAFMRTGAVVLASAATSGSWMAPRKSRRDALRLKTVDGDTVAVDNAAFKELTQSHKGDLLANGLPEYDAARRIWNAAIDRRPALIARCLDVHDIVRVVSFAERHNALVSVRGGGHNAAGFAICDGGLVIDLTALKKVEIEPLSRTARVGGGATFADYDAATHAFGLASTGPIISMVGVGGYTLGGGVGWLHRKLGLACDNLVSAQVVTADGKIVETSRARHADLFWALRGGGGNFGIVSSFEFRLAPVSSVLAGSIFHPLEDLPEVAALVRDFNAHAPDDVSVWLMMRKAPASAALPPAIHGRPVVAITVCYAGPSENGDRVVRQLRQFGRPLVDQIRVRSYADWQQSLDPAWGPGFGNQWLGHYLPEFSDASARTILEHVAKVSSPFTDVKLVTLGGAVGHVGEDETAFSYRTSKYALAIQTRWADVDQSAEHLAWSHAFFEAMKAHSSGKVYVNFMADEGPQRIKDAYEPHTFKRLQAIKAAYDPHNRFRMNQNIGPALNGA
jgi:FAD/FMN-containing dehydrogenase